MHKIVLPLLAAFATVVVSCGRYSGEWAGAKEIEKSIVPPEFRDADYFVTDFGAEGNGQNDAAQAINAAIDRCSQEGGGHVIIPRGEFFCRGSIFLKSNVDLHFEDGAKLIFSGNGEDFLPCVLTRWEGVEVFNYSPMIYARNVHNIAITGKGVIDGQGSLDIASWKKRDDHVDQHTLWDMGTAQVPVHERIFGQGHLLRPAMVEFMGCSRILLEDAEIVDGTFWSWHLIACSNATVRRIKVDSHNPNNDGFDPESCTDVLVEDCVFKTGDDGIAIKSGRDQDGWRMGQPTENVYIRRCTFDSPTNSICIGSEVSGGVRNIFVEDCKIVRGRHGIYAKSNRERGGYIENVHVRNIDVDTLSMALVILDADYHSQTHSCTTPFKHFEIKDVRASKAGTYGIFISGFDDLPIEDVCISDLTLDEVPEAVSFSKVKGLKLDNVTINGESVTSLPEYN